MSGFIYPNQQQIPVQFNEGMNSHSHSQSLNANNGPTMVSSMIPPTLSHHMGYMLNPNGQFGHQHSQSFNQPMMNLPPPPGFNYGNNFIKNNAVNNMVQYRQPQMMLLTPVQEISHLKNSGAPVLSNNLNYPVIPKEHQIQRPVEQATNGGVNPVLDYDLEVMTDYIVEFSILAFDAKDKFKENSKDNNQDSILTLFNKGVGSVLNATRLPSVTIFQGLHFLSKYLSRLPNRHASIGGNSINIIYQHTMIGLILANKFNDDKTFTNKSWSEATGMQLTIINEYERDWLKVFDWKLFDDKFILYNDYVTAYKTFVQESTFACEPIKLQSHFTTPTSATPLPHPSNEVRIPAFQSSEHLFSSPYFCISDDEYHHNAGNPTYSNQFQPQMSICMAPSMQTQPQMSCEMNGNSNFNLSSSPLASSPIRQGQFNNSHNNLSCQSVENYNNYSHFNDFLSQSNNLVPSQNQVPGILPYQPNFYNNWNLNYQNNSTNSDVKFDYDTKYFINPISC
ncbi:hypothetical protein TPHA_0D03470 [Tetrapisispora phaffii CBS 4417]|uniref:Cyclin N-terminal domain-containing protein n=1 Tax=Tetrapisispora phaffii (strain ATCC 24235 / CBS 4417 / NBRC 1672 / NRRL Y-8282 / UCD 70-5) TaxID=1071381 RepID=G8BT11_TETPH|nr:hypothetical protein TPHA_0D03470 [Tetrapisispora phaffii CBS 4417]CCE62982.1 hypothetical protein TPHA_0D03470 [Tetrapisispora phaffii CBS 4417]